VCSNLEIILSSLRLLISLSLSLSLVFIYLAYLYCLSLYVLDIFVLNCFMLGIVCSHLYSTKRAIVALQLLILRNLEEIVFNLSPKIRLHSLVILGVFSIMVCLA